MNSTTWFRKSEELDDEQKSFILLSKCGRYQLEGPPGSGKTNLLLLRAQYVAGAGDQNVLIVTYTKALADFIRSGISSNGVISPEQVQTFHSWAYQHVREYTGKSPLARGADFDNDARLKLAEAVIEANAKAKSSNLYSAIFIDEAQDLSVGELESILSLSDSVCICGDHRQGIYKQEGLSLADKLKLTPKKLTKHYRIGQKIARVADRIMKPENGQPSLYETCNYNVAVNGESSAIMHDCGSRDEQFELLTEMIRVQLDAFPGDKLGIFCPLRDDITELRAKFDTTDLADKVQVHSVDQGASFNVAKCPIHVMTIHSAKGTEFRGVFIYGAEGLKDYPMNSRRLAFTAVTRARTALNVFRTGKTNSFLENAFVQPKHVDLESLFE